MLDSIDERRCMGLNEVFKGTGADVPECLEARLLHKSKYQGPSALRILLWEKEDSIDAPEVLVALVTMIPGPHACPLRGRQIGRRLVQNPHGDDCAAEMRC